jgi:signal transduction histidine kinase
VTSLHRMTIACRVFSIAAILGLGLVSRDLQAILSLLLIATLATTAVYVSLTTPLATALVVTVEAAVTGLVIGLALPAGVVFLPYLVVLTLIAGVARGVVGVSAVVVAQFFSVGFAILTWTEGVSTADTFRALSPWLVSSIGMGLLGMWVQRLGVIRQGSSDDRSYESAHRLLTQLRTVARRLSSGLDPVTIGGHVLDTVADTLGTGPAGVFVRSEGGVVTPLAFSDDIAGAVLSRPHALVDQCWTEMTPLQVFLGEEDSHLVALPLRAGSRVIGVVLARVSDSPGTADLQAVMTRLDEHSLRLDTALTFDEIRSVATAEERSRLAREIHDGVAQEVTSLGYVVDDLIAGAESDGQRTTLLSLRAELTRVVGELRLSIFDLRSEVVRETGLGSALSEYVRQIGSRSAMAVHLTLDESPTRLRAETEAELLRIAQEAITNARKHSSGRNLWVDCVVDPPFARITVRDDGVGLSGGRSDSYGLRIMQERAQRVDAHLEVETTHDAGGRPSGTSVTVTLNDEPHATSASTGSEHADDPTGAEDRLARRRP